MLRWLQAGMGMALVGCAHLYTPGTPYRMGLGPNAFARVQKVDAFFFPPSILTEVNVKGGGYDFKLKAPKAQAALDLLLQYHNMSEPEGPTQVSMKGVAEVQGKVVLKSLEFGFDPVLARNYGHTRAHVETLNKLRELASQPVVDRRLDAIGGLLGRFGEVRSIEVDLPGGPHRFYDAPNIVRLLGDLSGVRTKWPRGATNAPEMRVKISYESSGKHAELVEKFGLDETVIQADDMEVSLLALADGLGKGKAPVSLSL